MLFTGKNICEIEKMLEFCEQQNIYLYVEILDYYIPIFRDSDLAKQNPRDRIDHNDLDIAINKFKQWLNDKRKVLYTERSIQFIEKYLKQKPLSGKCPLGITDIYIESNGNVYTGCWSFDPVGNVMKDNIISILNSEAYRRNVERMLKRECDGCTCGYSMQAEFLEL